MEKAATENQERFWDFSVRTYYGEGVQDAFLYLQDTHGVDINLLLFCIWHSKYYGLLSKETQKKAFQFSLDWADHAVIPLRNVRRWMKASGCYGSHIDEDHCMQLRDKIKSVEFAAEKLQEECLESFCSDLNVLLVQESEVKTIIDQNIDVYFASLTSSTIGSDAEKLKPIINSALNH